MANKGCLRDCATDIVGVVFSGRTAFRRKINGPAAEHRTFTATNGRDGCSIQSAPPQALLLCGAAWGISAAARHIPYGIGQPAISGQMADLERQLGSRLFERKPFQLTEQGRRLYGHLGPFFDGLGPLWQQLRGGPAHLVRIAADEMIAPEFLPAVLAAVAPLPPGTCFELRTGPAAELEAWLHERRVQLVITTADRGIRGVRSLALARPRLRLLVPRKAKINSPGHFWRQGRITEPLICPVEAGTVLRTFERGLQALRVEWPAGIRVDSTAIMIRLVAEGHGVGIGLELPSQAPHPEVRAIPLAGFDPVPLVARWRLPAGPWLETLLAAIRGAARRLWPAATLPAAAWFTERWIALANEFIGQFGALAWE